MLFGVEIEMFLSYCGASWTAGSWCYTKADRADDYKRCQTDDDCKCSYKECWGGCWGGSAEIISAILTGLMEYMDSTGTSPMS